MIGEDTIQGHWVRRWIKAPDFEDDTTRVHWIQAGRDYADVRIPAKRPAHKGASCLADLSPSALTDLARAEGFAGHITLDGDNCTWHREINWHGAPDGVDVGAISFDEDGHMSETGVLADYAELWVQQATMQTTALRFLGHGYTGILVSDGAVAVLGIGRPSKPATKPIIDALNAGHVPDNVDLLFDGVHAFCRVADGLAIAALATNPMVEEHPVLSFRDNTVIWRKVGFYGDAEDVVMQVETVLA